MAWTSCPKCNNHSFRMEEVNVSGCNYKLMMVECSSCGAAVGVMDYYNIGAQTEEIKGEITNIARDVKQNQHILGQIANALNHLTK